MQGKILLIVMVVGSYLLSGCASTSLTIDLDIYKEDVSYLRGMMSNSKIEESLNGLVDAQSEMDTLFATRTEIADTLYLIYRSVFKLTTEVKKLAFKENDLKALMEYLTDHKNRLRSLHNAGTLGIDSLRTELYSYGKLSGEVSNPNQRRDGDNQSGRILTTKMSIRKHAEDIMKRMKELADPLRTDFELFLMDNWNRICQGLTSENLVKLLEQPELLPEFDTLRNYASYLSKKMQLLAEEGHKSVAKVAKMLGSVSKTDSKSVDDLSNLMNTVPEILNSIGLSPKGEKSLIEITNSLYYDLIDRVQDAADPAWRIIGDPQNESKWNTKFSKTFFYAEGNNSIIIVRDSPISFRAQQGKNNPAALITGQLNIARAMTKLAVGLAGASMGISVPGTVPKNNEPSSDTALMPGSDSENLVRLKSELDRKIELRNSALHTLQANLKSFRYRLNSIENKEKYDEIIKECNSMLRANEIFFNFDK